jgi:hypothetical protein
MNPTQFDVISLLFTGLTLLGLPRLLRGWRSLVAPELSDEGRALAVYIAVFLAVPLATLAHEFGHLVVARGLGAKDATLHYRIFWGYVEYSTRLPGHGSWEVALAGNAVSWALAALALGFATTRCPHKPAAQASRAATAAAPSQPAASPSAVPNSGDEPASQQPPTSHPLLSDEARSQPPPAAPSRRGQSLPPGLCYALRTFGVLEMVHTLIMYPLMSLSGLPGADWSVIYGAPFWAGTWVVAAVHAASLLWLRQALREGWS